MAFLGKANKQDLKLLAEELGLIVTNELKVIDLKNLIMGSKDFEEEFVKAQLSAVIDERINREDREEEKQKLELECRRQREENELECQRQREEREFVLEK